MTVWARVLAGVVVIALVLGGLGVGLLALLDDRGDGTRAGNEPAPTPSAEPGARDAADPALAEFYEQELRWERCRQDFDCAELTVPVDYQEPEGATIDIAVLKDPADRPQRRVGSLVVNPGGPGVPGTSYAAASSFVFADVIRERFDIVGFDPRGTGSSSPVDCVSDRELDAMVALDPTPDQPAEVQQAVRTYDDFYAGCVDGSGELAGHVTTVEAARDMDVLRAALGEDELDYFGASYGTKLGATFAELFPERVGRFVLDGAVDVSLTSREASLKQAAGFETALRAYVENCVEETDGCFLGDSVDEGLQRIQGFLEDLDERPLPAGDRELTAGNAFYGLVFPLYNRDYWFMLSQALQSGFKGDGTALLRLADLYFSREADGSYADNSGEAILAINCLDDPYAITPEEVPAQVPEFEEASPTFGEVFAWGLVGCHGIQVRSSEPPLELRAEGAPPILVIGTTRDPATPYEGAVALAGQLESGVLLTRDGDGHTGYNQGNECVDDTVHAYLVEGEVPEDGAEC